MRYLWMSVAAFFLDLGIKEKVERSLRDHEKKSCLKGRIQIEKYHNYGAACNVLEKKPGIVCRIQTLALTGAAIYTASVLKKRGRTGDRVGAALLLAGGANNLLDRYRRGYVVDYLRFSTPWKWLNRMIFNISDFFIFFGVILMAVTSGKSRK